MPELPEVEAVRRRLDRDCRGARIIAVDIRRQATIAPQLPPRLWQACEGVIIREVARRAKHLFLHLENEFSVHMHLRMTGNAYVVADHRLLPLRARLVFALEDGRALVFDDPRCLGRVHAYPTKELESILPPLGPEPLEAGFSVKNFVDIARRSGKPAKLFLMDQSKVAGLGNIYAAEVLYEAGIDPRKPMGRLSTRRLTRLHGAIRDVLSAAILCCERAYSKPGQFIEADEYPVAVYGRRGLPCPRCDSPISRIPQGGRSTYFCPRCQR